MIMDRFKRLISINSIPSLWHVSGIPVTDEGGLVLSNIQYEDSTTGNIPIVIAPPLHNINTATTVKSAFGGFYPKAWIYEVLWHLYEKKQGQLLNNFFELVFHEEAITEIEFQFIDKNGGNDGAWAETSSAVITLGNATYHCPTGGETIHNFLPGIAAEIAGSDNTVQTSYNDNVLKVKVGARLAQLYPYDASVTNGDNLENIIVQQKNALVEKKLKALASSATTDLNFVFVDSDNYVFLGHTIKIASTSIDAPSVPLDDESEQDLIFGLGVLSPRLPGRTKPCPVYPGWPEYTCYFALFLVRLKALLNPPLDSFVEPTEFRDYLVFRLNVDQTSECDLKSIIGIPQIGECASAFTSGSGSNDDYCHVDDYKEYLSVKSHHGWYFGEDASIFPNYLPLAYTSLASSNGNRWIISSDPLFGIYGYHINGTTIIKPFRIFVEQSELKIEQLPSAGENALLSYDTSHEYSLTPFSWTDYAIYHGQLHASRQLNSPGMHQSNWYYGSHYDDYGGADDGANVQLEHQAVDYLIPYHKYQNSHWRSSTDGYVQEGEELAWRVAKFDLTFDGNIVYSTKYAYFLDGRTAYTSMYHPYNDYNLFASPEQAFEWYLRNQSNHMFFLAVPHNIGQNTHLLQPLARLTKQTFLQEYPTALGRTATVIDTSVDDAICYVHVGYWRNKVQEKCVAAKQILDSLAPDQLLGSDFTDMVNDITNICDQEPDIDLEWWSSWARSMQLNAIQEEIEVERLETTAKLQVWNEKIVEFITQYNAEANKIGMINNIKSTLQDSLFMQYKIIVNNFATPEIINMLEAGQSYVVIQPQ